MDKLKIAEALGSHPYGALWVKDVRLVSWGRDLAFECLYEPGAPSKPILFHLTLKDCREMRWRIYAHLDGQAGMASIVNISLGTGQHRKPANILTDFFGLTVSYGELVIEKDT